MKKRLIRCLLEAGAADAGVCEARVFDELRAVRGLCDTVFCESNAEKRVNPFLTMPSARSLLAFLVSYKSPHIGNISQYAYGRDYHDVLKKIAEPAADILRASGFLAECFCDSDALCDRHIAYSAGLGFFGKNRCLIHPKYGSFVFIGYIMTDCPLGADKPMEMSCGGCGKCVEACPSGALRDGDFSKCLSYLTQKKGELSVEEEELIKASPIIWGCDVCQNVCPKNAAAPCTELDAFCENPIYSLSIPEDISNREFRRRFGERAFSWRGKNVILRNQRLKKR